MRKLGTAIVTGGAVRIGREICKNLHQCGYSVVFQYKNSRMEADELCNTLSPDGSSCRSFYCDLSCPDSLNNFFNNAIKCFDGDIKVLVNNASMFIHDDIETITAKSIDSHYYVNIRAPTLLSSLFASTVKRQISCQSPQTLDSASIINILDQKISAPNGDHLSYTLSRYTLWGATEILSRSLAPHIRVNAVCPGYTLPSPQQSLESFAECQRQTPLKLGPTPREIANAVAFLLKSPSITGQTLYVDGGERFNARKRDVAFEIHP